MERRVLGRTGQKLSVIGFGGIALQEETPADAARFVARAIEKGINYFDVAPSYGNAEERLGPALTPYREEVFLAGKTRCRTASESSDELRETLRRLRTDHLDLYQFHAVDTVQEAERILGPGGAMEAFLKARDSGLIRFIGFSSHNEEAALFMLGRFPFDAMLFPVNFACWLEGGFGPRVIERASQSGAGIVAIKPLCRSPILNEDKGHGRRSGSEWVKRILRIVRGNGEHRNRKWPKLNYHPLEDIASIRAALEFALARPVTAALPPGQAELVWRACDALESPATPRRGDERTLVEALGGVPLHRSVV